MSKPSICPKPAISVPKKLLFASISTIAFFACFEFALALIGYQPLADTSDPLLGFSNQNPLLQPTTDKDGSAIQQTANGKLVWFNSQSFPAVKPSGTRRVFCVGGSTTYGRPFSDLTSYSGWLREFLAVADPSVDWEVINAGGISYASYRVAAVMQELANHEPDLFIVYTAHNEFLERRTYEGMFESSRVGRDISATLHRTRIGSLVRSIIAADPDAAKLNADTPAEQLPAEVDEMLNHSVGPQSYHRDDAWQAKVLRHYELNLQRMVSVARSANAEIVFVTPASNLRDCWPFKSESATTDSEDASTENSERMQEIRSMLEKEHFTDALLLCESILLSDPRNAEANFQAGRSLFGLDRFEEAESAFKRAIDEDVCPLRGTTQITETIKRVAKQSQVAVVDFEHELQLRSQNELGHRCFGREYFLDHVHPTISVHRDLALWILDKLQSQSIAKGNRPPKADIDRIERHINSLIDDQRIGVAFRNLAKVMHWAGKFNEAAVHASDAIELLPEDLESHYLLADCLFWIGRHEESIAAFEMLFRIGDYPRAYVAFGELLVDKGRWEEAKSYLVLGVLSTNRQRQQRALYLLGITHLRLQEYSLALDCFQQLDSVYQDEPDVMLMEAETYLGMGHDQLGIDTLSRMIELHPDNFDAHHRIALSLIALNRIAEAQRIDPSDSRIKTALAVIAALDSQSQ